MLMVINIAVAAEVRPPQSSYCSHICFTCVLAVSCAGDTIRSGVWVKSSLGSSPVRHLPSWINLIAGKSIAGDCSLKLRDRRPADLDGVLVHYCSH